MPSLEISMLSEEDVFSLSKALLIAIPSDVADRLHVMQRQESTTYKCNDYIHNRDDVSNAMSSTSHGSKGCDHFVDRECRLKMCEWCYQVADFCKFKRETVVVSMSLLDRFLSSLRPRARLAAKNRKEYQGFAMTALYVTVKMFEPLQMDASLLSTISRGCYTANEIVEMEYEMLVALSWMVNGPIAHDFLSQFVALLPPSVHNNDSTVVMSLLDFSRFQAEIAICDYDVALQKPSVVALAALLNSAEGIDESHFSATDRFAFLRSVANVSGMNPFAAEINTTRLQLLNLFSKNSGYELPQIAKLTPIIRADTEPLARIAKELTLKSKNPTPVSTVKPLTRRESFAKCV